MTNILYYKYNLMFHKHTLQEKELQMLTSAISVCNAKKNENNRMELFLRPIITLH